jgi:hypothetical protein
MQRRCIFKRRSVREELWRLLKWKVENIPAEHSEKNGENHGQHEGICTTSGFEYRSFFGCHAPHL